MGFNSDVSHACLNLVRHGLKKTGRSEEDINENIIFYMGDMEKSETAQDIWMDRGSVFGVEN